MLYSSPEDRLNPIAPAGADDTTLGGYASVHGRAPAFEGPDGQPYTVAVDAEPAESGNEWVAYLVFLRWAASGTAVMGHLESADLAHGETEQQARAALENLPLTRVRTLLAEKVSQNHSD